MAVHARSVWDLLGYKTSPKFKLVCDVIINTGGDDAMCRELYPKGKMVKSRG